MLTSCPGQVLAQSGGGSWQSGPHDPVYSCTASATGGSVSPPNPNSATVYGPNGSTLTITGTATITYTWHPTTGTTTPPPPCMIVHETLTTLTGALGGGAPGATVVTERWSAKDGSSGTVALSSGTMTASYTVNATNGDKSGFASLAYAAVSPVTINLLGTALDSSRADNILIGQRCTASLSGIPSALLNNTAHPPTYSWTVSGTKFQSWTVSSDHTHTTKVDGPGPLNQPTASWYWNELASQDRTVSCTATVTPPAGQGSPFTVTASRLVSVYVPNWTATGTGGYVKVNLLPNTTNYNDYEIYAGATTPMENVGQLNGMNIAASVASPAPTLFGDGRLELVQLVTPRESWVLQNGIETTPEFAPQYGEQGLDSVYPYGWATASISPGIPTYTTGDTPGFSLIDIEMISANLKHDFEDYLMYLAPGSQQPVPVARFIWNDNGNANIPSTFYWRDYAAQHNGSDAAGTGQTVTPSGNKSKFLPCNAFPSWTQID